MQFWVKQDFDGLWLLGTRDFHFSMIACLPAASRVYGERITKHQETKHMHTHTLTLETYTVYSYTEKEREIER